MYRDVTEKDMQQTPFSFLQNVEQYTQFARRKLPRHIAPLPRPEPSQEMQARFRDDVDGVEWKLLGVFAFLRDHDRVHTFERRDLPIDMQHFRFQKRRDVTSDNRAWVRGLNFQRSGLDRVNPLHIKEIVATSTS